MSLNSFIRRLTNELGLYLNGATLSHCRTITLSLLLLSDTRTHHWRPVDG